MVDESYPGYPSVEGSFYSRLDAYTAGRGLLNKPVLDRVVRDVGVGFHAHLLSMRER